VVHGPQSAVHRLIAQDRVAVRKIVSAARKQTKLTLITKLSPNVSDIKPIAKAAEDAGSDALSLINTVFGISIDIDTRKPNLANIVGGLSGPAIKPVALNFVHEAYSAVKIPIIGMGGIMTARDAIEFIICGSTAVGIGTANFVNPVATVEVINGIISYMRKNSIKNISSLVGSLK
jgi:dihydroorotate dehydrogenase (NAD+) catalytic subunit